MPRRSIRVLVLTVVLYVFVQLASQMAMELHFPMSVKWGPFTVVLFVDPSWPYPRPTSASRD